MGYLYTIIVTLAVFKTAQSLRCWKCQSEGYNTRNLCTDYFNQTLIRNLPRPYGSIDTENPVEENCESHLSHQITDQKAVCIKKVEFVSGRKHYTRRCDFIHIDLQPGECSKESRTNNQAQIEYCQQCDTDYCNSSNMPTTSIYWYALALVFSILLLKQ